MEKENLKYFELNNSVLKDFDKLMSMHLNDVEELKVSEIDPNSKLLNIISLCINIKTIIIEGDQRVNTNMIISNICKPELLENLVLINVKVPSGHTLKKLSGLKTITLENIRFTNIGAFFKEIPEPKKIEKIKITNSDFERNPVKIFERFENINKLELIDVVNSNLKDLEFISSNRKIKELKILNNFINMEEINNLLKCKANKIIDCQINSNENAIIKDRLQINEDGNSILTINSNNLDNFVNNVTIYKISKLVLILNNMENIDEYIKPLKKIKGALSILIKDASQLSKEDAQKLQKRLDINTIEMLSADEKNIEYSYQIEDYIKLGEEIEDYCNQISNELSEIERFLTIYKLLIKNISIDDNFEETTQDLNNLKNELGEKKCLSTDFSKILQNVLACMKIESQIISGNLIKLNKKHTWNQVKIDNIWYNVDIALDCSKIKNKKKINKGFKYCLLGDKNFYETHMPYDGKQNYAENDFDRKVLKVYFKTGILSDKLLKSYFNFLFSKIKILTKINKTKALPAPTETTDIQE